MITEEKIRRERTSLTGQVIEVIVLTLLVSCLIIGSLGMMIFFRGFKAEYSTTAWHMAQAAAALVNGDSLEAYLDGREAEEYAATDELLDSFCQRLNVSLIYVIRVDTSDYGRFVSVFNCVNNAVDDSDYTPWPLGYQRDTTNQEYRDKYRLIYEEDSSFEIVYRLFPQDGSHIHLTAMVPVKHSDGTAAGILCLQRPLRELQNSVRPYVLSLLAFAVLFAFLASFCSSRYIRRQFIAPIVELSAEAARFARENTPGHPAETASSIREISDLAVSLDTMEKNMVSYIRDLTAATAVEERIHTELTLAGQIQTDELPDIFPAFPGREDFDIHASMTPALMIGGDFYNFLLLDENHLAMWIADVSGKGIPAALFMMLSNRLLRERTRAGGTPAEILADINNSLCENNKAEMFVTVWLGILDLSTGNLIAANAGHEHPALYKDGLFELVNDRHGFVLGGMPGMKYRDYELTLAPGGKLFVYSDGVPEASSAGKNMFGTDRMLQALNRAGNLPPKGVLDTVKEAVDLFVDGAAQFDDLTMLCVEYRGKETMHEDNPGV